MNAAKARKVLGVGAAVTMVMLTTSCGAFAADGSATNDVPSENAVNTEFGNIRIDDAYIVAPTPTHAVLRIALTNQGGSLERLLSLSAGASDSGTPTPRGEILNLTPGATVNLEDTPDGIPVPQPHPAARAGADLTLTLDFARAGTETLTLPVVASAP